MKEVKRQHTLSFLPFSEAVERPELVPSDLVKAFSHIRAAADDNPHAADDAEHAESSPRACPFDGVPRSLLLHIAVRAIDAFRAAATPPGTFPAPMARADRRAVAREAQRLLQRHNGVNSTHFKLGRSELRVLRKCVATARGLFPPLHAVVGGIMAQEVGACVVAVSDGGACGCVRDSGWVGG